MRVRDFVRANMPSESGCHDAGCYFGPTTGPHTQGGCRCLGETLPEVRVAARRLARLLAKAVADR